MSLLWHPAPFGLSDLEEDAGIRYSARAVNSLVSGDQVRCCIRGCTAWLPKRMRGAKQSHAYCPSHGISISISPTYVYSDYRKNFIVGRDVLGSVNKVESWRLGNESSEDALSWNVFVGLSRLGALGQVFKKITGFSSSAEPELYMWGNRVHADSCEQVWAPLKEVRNKLENGLGIPTEPDVILRLPGKAIVLIEAKFASPNGTLKGKEARFGSVRAFLDRYRCRSGCSDPLDREFIGHLEPHTVMEQLCRNVIFSHWLAGPDETPFVVNLVSQEKEKDIEEVFRRHLATGKSVEFRRATWEEIANLPRMNATDARPLRDYLANKTIRLQKAFTI